MKLNKIVAVLLSSAFLPIFTLPAQAADNPIEPGSPESAIEWTLDSIEYVDGVMSGIHTGNWGYQTIQYANDVKSLLMSYQAFYDNQNQWTGVLPQFETLTGFVGIKDDSPNGYRLEGVTCTGVMNYSQTDYRTPAGFAWFRSGAGFMSTTSQTFPNDGATGRCVGVSDGGFAVTFFASGQTNGTFCYAQPWQMDSWSNGFAVDFFEFAQPNTIYNPGTAYGHPACIITYTPQWRNRPYKISSDGTVQGLKDLYQKIEEQYPEREDIFPEMTPPEADPDYNPEEPTEEPSHPSGCHCEVHVVVTVDVNHDDIEFPTYNVTDVPEPSDFDFDQLETLDPEATDQFVFDMEEVPSDVVSGASFWFELMDSTADIFKVKTLVIMLLSIALLMFFLRR